MGLSYKQIKTLFFSIILTIPILAYPQEINWYKQYYIEGGPTIEDICFLNESIGWAVGSAGIVLSTDDGGQNWNSITNFTENEIFGIYFLNESQGWMVGHDGIIYHTSDAGATWNLQNSGTTNRLYDVFFLTENLGWAISTSGEILNTLNGGKDWGKQNSETYNALLSIEAYPSGLGWACGWFGTILKTYDAGNNWFFQTSPVLEYLTDVQFIDNSNGWIVGTNGALLKTSDGGDNWIQVESIGEDDLYDIFFLDADNGWVCGNNGAIYRTGDGGKSWKKEITNFDKYLFGLQFTDLDNGWACGNDGTILKRNIQKSVKLTLNETDIWAELNQLITISGKLTDSDEKELADAVIEISDGSRKISTQITTSDDGSFVYHTSANVPGIFKLTFGYRGDSGEVIENKSVLLSINNTESVAIFRSIILRNDTSEPLVAAVSYKGTECYGNEDIINLTKEYEIEPQSQILVIDGSQLEYDPHIIDSTPNDGPPTGRASIAYLFCPLQLGSIESCWSANDDPESQIFTISAGLNIVNIGFLYDLSNKDFCVSVELGTPSLPYMFKGSGAINFCSNGISLSASTGAGAGKAIISVEVWNREESHGMDAITTYIPIYSPVNPLIIDPLGRKIGIDPETDKFINEIPNAIYTGPAEDPQIINIPYSEIGNYDLTLKGNDQGSYLIHKHLIRNNSVINHEVIDGNANYNEIISQILTMDTNYISLGPPENISVIRMDNGFQVSWDHVQDAYGYKLYYDIDITGLPYKGSSAIEGGSPIDVRYVNQFEITGLDADSTYYISITSYDSNDIQGNFSEEVSIKFPTIIRHNNFSTSSFALMKNYPNPFNSQTAIEYSIPKNTNVNISIYNLNGQKVETLINRFQSKGFYRIEWNGVKYASGVYYSQLELDDYRKIIKMLLLK